MIKLITYSDESMSISAKICCESAFRNNVHEVKAYMEKDIERSFFRTNKSILIEKRGAGYWLWKPYFIFRELVSLNEGDYLIYSDAGVEFINNIRYVIDRMDSDIFLFGNSYQHVHWCKSDVIAKINGFPKSGKLFEGFGKQCQASVIIIKNTKNSRKFISEWLLLCQNKNFIDDSKSVFLNHEEFQEHRHDQAILTCLAYRDKIKLHWWPAMYNAGAFTYDHAEYSDNYPVIFHHHRFRNEQFNNNAGIDGIINNYFKSKKYQAC